MTSEDQTFHGTNPLMMARSGSNIGWKPHWKAKQVVAFNMLMRDFAPGAKLFADLKSEALLGIIRSLAWICNNPPERTGAPTTADGPGAAGAAAGVAAGVARDMAMSNSPDYVTVVEELMSEPIPGRAEPDLVGYRLFVVLLNPSEEAQFWNSYQRLMKVNSAAFQDACGEEGTPSAVSGGSSRRRGRGGGGGVKMSKADWISVRGQEPECALMGVLDLIQRLWTTYLGEAFGERSGDLDTMFSAANGMVGAGKAYDPVKVLSLHNAMTLRTQGVCSAQRDIRNYLPPGETHVDKFECSFQTGTRVTRLHVPWFTPSYLAWLPLPDKMRAIADPILAKYNDLSSRHDALKVKQRSLSASGAFTPARNTEINNDLEWLRMSKATEARMLTSKLAMLVESSPSQEIRGTLDKALSGSSFIDKIIKSRNAIFAQRDTNFEMMESVVKRNGALEMRPDEITADVDQMTAFFEEVQTERLRQLGDMYKIITTTTRATATVRSSRDWFAGLPGAKSHWVEHNRTTKDLSPFGDMIRRMTNDMDDAMGVETNFQLMHISILVGLAAFRFSWELRPNLLVTGDAGTGKSFASIRMKQYTFPGCTINASNVTQKAFEVSGDMSDLIMVHEELEGSKLGIDKNGRNEEGDAFFKNRLTSQLCVTLSPDIDPETRERTSIMSVNRAMGSMLASTNERVPDHGENPTLSRFMRYKMKAGERLSIEGAETATRTTALAAADADAVSVYHDSVRHGWHLHSYYFFLAEKMIEGGALPDVTIDAAKIVFTWVFTELAKMGITPPSRRHMDMGLDLCRVMTIYYAIEMEFFSEFSIGLRADPVTGEPRPFKGEYLEGLVKWLVCTQEIAIYVLTLLDFLWMPKSQSAILKQCGVLANGGFVSSLAAPSDGDAPESGRWVPKRGVTTFRVEWGVIDTSSISGAGAGPGPGAGAGAGAGPGPGPGPGPGAAPPASTTTAPHVPPHRVPGAATAATQATTLAARFSAFPNGIPPSAPPPRSMGVQDARDMFKKDYHYIEISGSSITSIIEFIRDNMREQPSMHDVSAAIYALAKRFVNSYPMTFDSEGKWVRERDSNGVTLPAKRIPQARIEDIGQDRGTDGNKRTLCIATAVLGKDAQDSLSTAIMRAMCHKHQRPQTMITAFSYVYKPTASDAMRDEAEDAAILRNVEIAAASVENSRASAGNGESEDEEYFEDDEEDTSGKPSATARKNASDQTHLLYNVYSTLKILRHRTREQTIKNPYGRTKVNDADMFNLRDLPDELDSYVNSDRTALYDAVYSVDEDIDPTIYRQHCAGTHINPLEGAHAIPAHTHTLLWKKRAEEISFAELETRRKASSLQNYPYDFARHQVRRVKSEAAHVPTRSYSSAQMSTRNRALMFFNSDTYAYVFDTSADSASASASASAISKSSATVAPAAAAAAAAAEDEAPKPKATLTHDDGDDDFFNWTDDDEVDDGDELNDHLERISNTLADFDVDSSTEISTGRKRSRDGSTEPIRSIFDQMQHAADAAETRRMDKISKL